MEGFKYNDMASAKVEDDGVPHTINQCKKSCYNLRQDWKEPKMNGKQWQKV